MDCYTPSVRYILQVENKGVEVGVMDGCEAHSNFCWSSCLAKDRQQTFTYLSTITAMFPQLNSWLNLTIA